MDVHHMVATEWKVKPSDVAGEGVDVVIILSIINLLNIYCEKHSVTIQG